MSEVPPPSRRALKATEAGAAPTAAEQIAAGDALDDHRLPTAQLERAAFGEHIVPWSPPAPTAPPSVAPWALAVAIAALIASLFAGVLLPLGVIAIVMSIISLRRAQDSRRVAIWALALAVLSVIFSAGWLLWALPQLSPV
ncbi:hypothetical protein [Microbacterium sp. RURRCA19A]|uniref:hypothetical protein n=1 Tax=Microbacterium sp. RURRCA19A TaxID=1907391 RepID=UPI000955E796|nr:hypothetical protein [Microbacterium sp. RURRCA19A]SIR75907.1 hypothetical protein SAMN05880568_1330 [Microbacterium sp. RURRCA19A]